MQSYAVLNQQRMKEDAARSRALNEAAQRVLQRLFGCWQHNLSRPITHEGKTYRVCVKCGLSRNFNPNTWETYGASFVLRPDSISPN
jgi:hypothetical protein